MGKKHTYEYVKQYFEEQGCELLEENYINAHIKMKYKCSCNNISSICFNKFQQGRRCNKCRTKRISEKLKHSFKFVKQYFKDNNCELLEKKYVNNFNKMKYRCSCKNISKINFNNFKQGKKCVKCGGTEKFTLEYVKQFFEDRGCELLEKEYKNNSTKMKYRCSCGNISKIIFNNFKQGQRCKKCGIIKNSGKNNWRYNPNLTDEEREKNKNRTSHFLYKRWRKKIFRRDKFICQNCFEKNKLLNAHHIISWVSNKELRLLESNGITFCEDCHIEFHKIYGKDGNNNREQLNEYFKILV